MILVSIAAGLSKASPQAQKGEKRRKGRAEKTTGIKYSLYEGQDIGEDSGSPIDFTYTPPFPFTGHLNKVTVELK